MHANVRASRAEQRLFDGGTASPLASRKASRQHACMHDPGEGNACVTRGRKTCTTGGGKCMHGPGKTCMHGQGKECMHDPGEKCMHGRGREREGCMHA